MNRETFLIAEFDALRREIELEIKELGEFLRYAILSSGAIWAWLLSQPLQRISHIACFVPTILSVLLLGETLLVRAKVVGLGKYLQRIEHEFSLPEQLGWETQLTRGGLKRDRLPYWENTVWALLCVGNLAGTLIVILPSSA